MLNYRYYYFVQILLFICVVLCCVVLCCVVLCCVVLCCVVLCCVVSCYVLLCYVTARKNILSYFGGIPFRNLNTGRGYNSPLVAARCWL